MSTSSIYDRFLRGKGKVKIFPTKSNVRPVEISKRLLRKAYPFLLASAFVVFGSSFKSADKDDMYISRDTIACNAQDFDGLYSSVIKENNVVSLKKNEPLSDDLIKEILNSVNLPNLSDFNYNHFPQDVDNFWCIVRNGVDICMNEIQHSTKLTKEQKTMYKIMANKMLNQIYKIKGTKSDVDLLNYQNLKSFLFFEKVINYRDNFNKVIKKYDGLIDEKAEIFGRYYEDYQNFYSLANNDADIVKFSESLYFCSAKDTMLDKKNKDFYNRESMYLLEEWKKSQKIYDENIYNLSSLDDDVYCNSVAFYYRRGKDLFISLSVDKNGDMVNGLYSPVGEIIIHELIHVMQRQPSSAENGADNLSSVKVLNKYFDEYKGFIDEIGPTLMTITINDYLYKKANNINQNMVVDYGNINIDGRDIKLGELAMWFRDKLEQEGKQKNSTLSIDGMLAKPKIFNELRSISRGYMPKSNLIQQTNMR